MGKAMEEAAELWARVCLRYHFITEMPCILSIRFLAGECQRKQTLLRKKTPSYKEGVRKIVYIAKPNASD